MSDATRHSRRISPGTRRILFEKSGGFCQRCRDPIATETFHVAHLRAASHGGPAIESNLEAWCPPCNIKNGNRDVRDTRVPLRAWQNEALPIVLEAVTMQRMATVMAAPGAGKTVFAGAVFVAGQEAGLWQRLLVAVPRLPLVEQWKDALLAEYHIALDTADGARQSGLEMRKMDGVCTTYQALLSPGVRERHRYAVQNTPTLLILDEVHHLGQLVHDEDDAAAWASAVRELAGDIRTGLNVAGVLNLSGTLFRTSPKERISTVAYESVTGRRGEDRIQAIANYTIHPDRLVREGLLRAPDLFRVGATVEIVNLQTEEVTVSAIADLDEDDGAARLALRRLNNNTEWVAQLVKVTLDELARRHRDGKNAPVKALIVAHRQDMARLFEKEVNLQMLSRGLQPLAECVVSDDGADAYRRLTDFRLKKRVGVLCTVGMAGEGYDCPDIAVVTYATNVLTAQYIRQVVARGQRITSWEREKVGHPLSVAIILPDVPELVEQFKGILAPMVHDIELPVTSSGRSEERPQQGDLWSPSWSDRDLVAVRNAALEVVSAVGSTGSFDADPALADLLTPILRDVNLPESSWPRVAQVIDLLNQQRPFQPAVIAGTATAVAVEEPPAAPTRRPLTPREHHDVIRRRLTLASGWWAQFAAKQGREPVAHFMAEIYRRTGIKKLDDATPDQLTHAVEMALSQIQGYCRDTNTPLPKWFRAF